mgnify:FL=1
MWYSKVKSEVEVHKQKLWAIFRCNFAVSAKSATIEECALYKRDPRKYADEPDLLPAIIEEARRRDFARQPKAIMGRGKRGAK